MLESTNLGILPAYLGKRMQMAFVVPDLDESLRFWTDVLKVGPFVVIENAMSDRHFIHRGQQSKIDISLAFSYVGETQIEVIAQTNDGASPYKEFLDSGRQGLHHVAFWPEDTEGACKALQQSGFDEVCSARALDGGGKVVYFSGPDHLGVMLEIAPMTPARSAYFAGIKALADAWDGSRPCESFAPAPIT
ncbi:VOC family protein [Variovorax sp. E3]|uniref:VOC family protein n=1 Tax=Variovorax sp. E3 TaxID=1914993 RepID=UPI0018DD977B|nr:VOC family protein [Variovorax sp. E3]